ncbi:MAG: hypothetical protein ABFS86_03490 [Planctomycetota bacterium]
MKTHRLLLLLTAFALLPACSLIPQKVPDEAPPLVDMEIDLAAAEEPADEDERQELDHGTFSGLVVGTARTTLDEEEPAGLRVVTVVENSPADAAGLEIDDILFVVVTPDGGELELAWPSEWRKLELETPPGAEITVLYDRAGLELEAKLVLVKRVRPPGREETARFRESRRAGVVLRTATEVEARSAGMGPGGGAVVIGLSLRSPWRAAGIRYGDLVVSVDGKAVAHPQVVLDAIRDGEEELAVGYLRPETGKSKVVTVPLTRREKETKSFYFPILWDYESEGGRSEMSILLGLFGYTRTAVAVRYRVLWLITFTRGDADRLVVTGGESDH